MRSKTWNASEVLRPRWRNGFFTPVWVQKSNSTPALNVCIQKFVS
jgi:hypothetical protein